MGDLLKMGQFVSLSHSPQTAHAVNKTQVLRIRVVCCICTNHSSILKMAATAGNPHTQHAPQHISPDYNVEDLLLNDSWLRKYTADTKLHVNCCHRYEEVASMSWHTAHVLSSMCSKNCQRDWGNVHTPNVVNVLERQITILGNSKVHQLQLCRVEQLKFQVIRSLPYKVSNYSVAAINL